MSRFKNTVLISTSISAILSASVQSQEKGSVPVGTFELTPSLNATIQKDSNVTRSSTDEIDSWVTILNPELKLGKQIGENQLNVEASATKGIYHSSDTDNYNDYKLSATGNFEFDRRNHLYTSLMHDARHDARGTSYSTGFGQLLDGPDKYKIDSLTAIYSYGALTAKSNLDVRLKIRDIDYDADFLEVLSSRPRDRKEKNVGSTFYYGISPTTDLLVDANYLVTDYADEVVNVASYDSDTKSILVGAKWENSAVTSGFVKVGYQKREFDDAIRKGFSGIKWEAGVAWSPIERSVFEFSSASDTQETNGQGSYIRRKDYLVDWRHGWLDRFDTVASIGYSDDSYEGGSFPRNDKTKEYKLGAEYQFRRWIKLIAAVSYFSKDSDRTDIDFDFDQSLVSFTAKISL